MVSSNEGECRYGIETTPAGDPALNPGLIVRTRGNADGSWQLYRDIWNADPATEKPAQ